MLKIVWFCSRDLRKDKGQTLLYVEVAFPGVKNTGTKNREESQRNRILETQIQELGRHETMTYLTLARQNIIYG
jgi:hypothetical protein